MKIHDLKKARQSKNASIASNNIKDILKVLELTNKALMHFQGYKSVQAILATIKYEKVILESHLEKFRKLKNKDE